MLFTRFLLLSAFTLPLHGAYGEKEAGSCTDPDADADAEAGSCMIQVKKGGSTGAQGAATKRRRSQTTKVKVTGRKTIDGFTVTYQEAEVMEVGHNATKTLIGLCRAAIAVMGCGDPDLTETAKEVLSKLVDGSLTLESMMRSKRWAPTIEDIEVCALEYQSAETAFANGDEVTASDVAAATGVRGEEVTEGAVEGDMIPVDAWQALLLQGTANASAGQFVGSGRSWSGGHVKYCFAPDVPAHIKHIFAVSTQQFRRALPCLSFEDVGWLSGTSDSARTEQKCASGPAIFVMAKGSAGCYSYVGQIRQWDSQQLQLNPRGCASLGTVMHELGHALGMAHEQSRPDRDQYVTIHWENIREDTKRNFQVDPNEYAGIDYDFRSLMHYDVTAFSINGEPTITRPDGSRAGIGSRSGLSSYDVTQMQVAYKVANPACEMNGIGGTGCISAPNDEGEDYCGDITSCGGEATKDCCVCGGGIEVQCYEGEECPQRPENNFPPPPETACIHSMNYGQYSCIYRNTCDYHIQFSCEAISCDMPIGPLKGWYQGKCQGAQVSDICSNPSTCTAWRV